MRFIEKTKNDLEYLFIYSGTLGLQSNVNTKWFAEVLRKWYQFYRLEYLLLEINLFLFW